MLVIRGPCKKSKPKNSEKYMGYLKLIYFFAILMKKKELIQLTETKDKYVLFKSVLVKFRFLIILRLIFIAVLSNDQMR